MSGPEEKQEPAGPDRLSGGGKKARVQSLSVVFSFRNEEEVIPELIRRMRNVLDPLDLDYELLFVNDASTDGSLALLLSYHERDKRIKIINLSRRFGTAAGVLAGLHHAKGDAVVYMDSDLQDPPELIPTLLEKLGGGVEVVHTVRTGRKGENRFKLWITRQAYRIIDFFADIDIPRDAGDFKLLSRRAVQEVLRLREYDPFMRGLVSWIGFRQAWVLYEREPRFSGKTHFSLLGSLNPFREFVRGLTSFSELPLYFGLVAGLFTWLVALASFVGMAIAMFTGRGGDQKLWGAVGIAFLLSGSVLFAIGILGLYVGRIHYDTKQRPRFIIESEIGFEEENPEGPGDPPG